MASIKIWTADGWKYVTSKGDKGEGVPTGGALGQILSKKTAADFDTEWIAAPTGGTSVSDASETVKGIVELATQTEVDTGTDTVRAITPATLKAKIDALSIPAPYTHPTGDGNLHVPATGTTNSGKVLTAGAVAGTVTWETPAAGGGSVSTATFVLHRVESASVGSNKTNTYVVPVAGAPN